MSSIERSLLPPGAFDTHVHVFDPTLGSYHPLRAYTPANAPLHDLLGFLSSLTNAQKPINIVLVQPSPYKTDNKVLLAALSQLQADASVIARGIAVVDLDSITKNELKVMHDAGIRGLRLNLQADGRDVDMELLQCNMRKAADLIKDLPNWKLQIYCRGSMWERMCCFLGNPNCKVELTNVDRATSHHHRTSCPGHCGSCWRSFGFF